MEYAAAARVQPPKPPIRSTTTIAPTAATAPHSRSVSPSKLSPTKLSMAEPQDIMQISASSSMTSMSNLSSTDLTSTNRPTRSKSLHGTASSGSMKGLVPTPPPRRRPESVQVTGLPFVNAPTSAPSATTAGSSPFNVSRRSSVQHPPPRSAHSLTYALDIDVQQQLVESPSPPPVFNFPFRERVEGSRARREGEIVGIVRHNDDGFPSKRAFSCHWLQQHAEIVSFGVVDEVHGYGRRAASKATDTVHHDHHNDRSHCTAFSVGFIVKAVTYQAVHG
ncbi:hypothetical protein FS837_012425 [Tulasnella sp. UAMH 9824]|nr:hypothetical protein FS837_012425 [Tulasnella sp. UAMH 9824]